MARISAFVLLVCLPTHTFAQLVTKTPTTSKMEVAVWDTYVTVSYTHLSQFLVV